MSLVPGLIAVYGTLRQACGMNVLLREPHFSYEGKDEIYGTMYSRGAYPCVYFDHTDNVVDVEVYRINNPDHLHFIHDYEGFSGYGCNHNLFTPRVVTLNLSKEKALCYEYTGSYPFTASNGQYQIQSGDWAFHIQEVAASKTSVLHV
jgi:gamma-glutamylcyclotransferase (GGCT)/AIG2-like uncharacterized protein YtfP